MAAVSSNPLGVDTNVVSLLSFDSELPLKTAVETLAEGAKLKFRYAPELMTNNTPSPALNAPVGTARFEQMTAFEALQRLLRKNDLVLGQYAGSPGLMIGTKESKLTPVVPEPAAGGGDLAAAPGAGGEFEVFSDTTAEIPLQTAILMLARFAKMPIVMDPRLKTGGERYIGTNVIMLPSITNITVNLSSMGDLSARQRLAAILKVHDLDMVPDPVSQTYTITYKEPGAKEPLIPNVVPLRYSNTTNVMTLLQSVFPPPTRIQADTRTASLLVISTAKDYDSLTNLVAQLDTPTKQVLIEARFVDTLLNPESFKGVNWAGTLRNNTVTFGNGNTAVETINQATRSTQPSTTPNGRPGPTTTTTTAERETTTQNVVDPLNPGFTMNTAQGFSPSTAFLNAQGLSVVLSFLNQDADTRTLSTPRAVTLDNQETRLQVTRAIPIFDQSEGIGQSGSVVSSSKPSYTNVGTILLVTPRISGTNVEMRLQPEISDTELQLSTKTVAGKVNQADIFTMQKIDTHVMIPSGNTLVMGGLSQDISNKGFTKVPFLGDIPVLGWAFRSESIQRKKRNIFIFVTPTIIEDADYQPYRTDFLNTKMPEHPVLMDDPVTSAKPAKFDKNGRVIKTKAMPSNTDGAPGFE
ncbi:MAG TPA: secretin N-terminal domain-containing protein [Verrucomicrobiae bacterium]|nr:secretin N-terminal domain-containing protein [Verrucomicrobiae bacterium]